MRELSLTFETADAPVVALSKVNLQVQAGEFVSLIGPSGCGKTTLMRVMADLVRPTGGQVTVNGMSPAEARLARAYGYVFQAPALYAWRTVRRNLMLPLEIMGVPKPEREKRAAQYLAHGRPAGLRRQVPVAALGRHAAARVDRPRARPSSPSCS